MKNILKFSTATFTVIALLSGCVSIPEPVVIRQANVTKTVTKSDIRPKKILLVFDISLEYPHIPSGLFFSKEDNIDKTYGNVGRILVKKIADQGIDAEYLIQSSPIQVPRDNSGYSHILIEKLYKFTAVTSSQGSYSSYRQWSATLLEVGNTTEPKTIYEQEYMSDGVSCFSITQYAKKEECKTKYVEHLLNHLLPIGITDNTVDKFKL